MDKSCMSAFTDIIDASSHKHCMLQLFFSFDNNLSINVNGDEINCKCIIVNTNVVHSFNTQNKLHSTMLINAASPLFFEFKDKYLQNKDYYIFDNEKIKKMLLEIVPKHQIDIQWYEYFVTTLFNNIDIKMKQYIVYDSRILEVIKQLEVRDCMDHSINKIAKNIALSPSRLSHLFKEQTGMALKSYIVLHMLQRTYLHFFKNGNITEAALEAGFDSPSHFAATNKKLTGMSATNICKNSMFLKASFI
jgi:AraC-like DNA-binding protein